MFKKNKKSLREYFLKKRNLIGDLEIQNRKINKNLIDYFSNFKGKNIAGYLPIRNEVDILISLTYLSKNNLVCVPVIIKKNESLKFGVWEEKMKLVEGIYKILIPSRLSFITPEILLIPLVAFDRKKNRLGYGGGFYDKTIESLKKKQSQILLIGIGFDEQECKQLPIESYDQPLDLVITQSRIIK